MHRIATAAVIAIALTGCAEALDYATLTLYQVQRKELVFVLNPCGDRPGKPAMVSAWVREKDRNKMLVVCDEKCNCRLTTQPTKGASK